MNCRGYGLLLLIFLLPACEMTVAVSGVLGDGETLSGSLTQYSDGGTIEVFGGPNTHCVGNFDHRRDERAGIDGKGMLVCDDRRSGPFTFVLNGHEARQGRRSAERTAFRFSF